MAQPTDYKKQVAELEVANGLKQFDAGIQVIETYLEPDRPFALRRSLLQYLQKIALEGIEPDAGEWRTGPVHIEKSPHQPPGQHLVGGLVDEMCDYINDHWHERTPFHLAAYVMWRLNWIHPFREGNGRTSRIVSYVVLCTKLGYVLPGSPTIPEQIQNDRSSYFRALEAADAEYAASNSLDVTPMEEALKAMLANQLLSVIEEANGTVVT